MYNIRFVLPDLLIDDSQVTSETQCMSNAHQGMGNSNTVLVN